MSKGGYATPYHDLLAELRRREMAVQEQKNLVDRFVIELFSHANLSPERNNPKPRRTPNRIVHGFVIDALNALPVEHQRNGKTKLIP